MPLLPLVAVALVGVAAYVLSRPSGQGGKTWTLTPSDSGKTYTVHAGDWLKLVVPKAPAGYSWVSEAIAPDPSGVQIALIELANTGDEATDTLNFQAARPGVSILGATLVDGAG